MTAPLSATSTPSTPSAPGSSTGLPSGTAGNAPPAPSAPEPFRYGAGPGVPDWAVGRTAHEVLGLTQAAVDRLQQFNQGHVVTGAPAAPNPEPAPSRFDLDLRDEDYVTGAQAKAMLARAAAYPVGDPVARHLAASSNLMLLRQAEHDAFRRWGPELETEISRLPAEHRSVDNLKVLVDIVKSRHVQELAEELGRQQAERLMSEQVATIRSGAGGSTTLPNGQPSTLDNPDLPEAWVKQCRDLGITMAQVDEFCQATGDTRESYFKLVQTHGKSAVVHG